MNREAAVAVPTRPGGLDRFALGVFPTPLHRAHRLEAAIGCGPVWIKRDDLAGFGVAGNKTRPLEYLIGDALARGADVLVTGGGPGSNFLPAAALAARAAGLACELVVWGEVAGAPNLELAVAAGAVLRPTGSADRAAVDQLVRARAAELAAGSRRPYAVPRGGSTGIGAAGFAVAATELTAQLAAAGVVPGPGHAGSGAPAPAVVLPVGSGGSVAGLTTGLAGALPVLGVSVSRPLPEMAAHVAELAAACADLLGVPAPAPPELVDARGPGFGVASAREREAARLALHTEGLFLDDTYGAKAFAVLLDRLPAPGPVVYWHTGGLLPALTRRPEALP